MRNCRVEIRTPMSFSESELNIQSRPEEFGTFSLVLELTSFYICTLRRVSFSCNGTCRH